MPFLSEALFSELKKDQLQRKDEVAAMKSHVIATVFPILCGSMGIPNGRNVVFDRIETIYHAPRPHPALYDGVLPSQVHEKVMDDLGHLIIPSVTNFQSPVAPNIFVEIQAPCEDENLIRCRATYNGAVGARAMHGLQTYGCDKPTYDNIPYVITMTYQPETGTLQMFSTHVSKADRPGASLEYHMNEIGDWDLTHSYDSFQQGVLAFRNARDWAKGHRDRLIEAANAKARASK